MGRKSCYLALVLAGAAAAVLPTAASSEGPPVISAQDSSGSPTTHRWSPATVTIATGGAVVFQYQPGDPPQGTSTHNVVFQSPPSTPSCTGVPQTSGSSRTAPWSGSCTFTAAGTYSFICTVHGASMSGAITVTPTGTTSGPGPGAATTPGATTRPPAGGVPDARGLRAARSQTGTSVNGSVTITHARSSFSARLTAGGSLAKVTDVGSVTKTGVRAGLYRFSVALGNRGKRALRRRRSLSLRLRITVRARGGISTTLATSVKLRQR